MLKKIWQEKKIWVIVGSISIFLILLAATLLVLDQRWKSGDTIASHVRFLGTDLEGLTKDECYAVVYELYQEQLNRNLHLTANDLAWDHTAASFGLTDNSDIVVASAHQVGRTGNIIQRYKDRIHQLYYVKNLKPADLYVYNEETKKAVLSQLSEDVGSTAQDARFQINGTKVTIVPSQTGTALNKEKTWTAIEEAIHNPEISEVALIIEENMDPEITTAELEAMNINTMLSSFSTNYNAGQAARSHNMALASSSLDMVIVKPGETFSFNDTVGQRTAARGYKQAIIIENGSFTPGMGGGVCQVSTTLYGAIIRTDLTVVERNPHSIPIAYVRAGQDAMVAWGSSDLKFRNDFDSPVLIHTLCGGGSITMMIFGSDTLKKEVEIVSEIIRYLPFSTETKVDKSLAPGKTKVQASGNRGLECKVFRKLIEDGETVSTTQISHDTYRPEKRVVLQGPAAETIPTEETPSTETPETEIPETPETTAEGA